jgi:hypothetical protein
VTMDVIFLFFLSSWDGMTPMLFEFFNAYCKNESNESNEHIWFKWTRVSKSSSFLSEIAIPKKSNKILENHFPNFNGCIVKPNFSKSGISAQRNIIFWKKKSIGATYQGYLIITSFTFMQLNFLSVPYIIVFKALLKHLGKPRE